MKRRAGKKASGRADFWEEKIADWKKTNIPQSTYCELNKLSVTAFSKWKKKLHPNLTARHPIYRVKSKYYKFTKIEDQKIEALIRHFLRGTTAEVASEKTGIQQNTIYKFYNDFRLAFVTNALLYWKLFNGAGTLLMLGPPPNLEHIIKIVSDTFPAHKPSRRIAKLRSRKNIGADDSLHLKSNLQILTAVLLYFSRYKLTLAEIDNFRNAGYRLFYKKIYAPYRNLDPNFVIKSDQLRVLYKEANNASVARSNWDYWVAQNDRKLLLPESDWMSYLSNKEIETNVSSKSGWDKQIYRDFCWTLKKHKISEKNQVISKYWDEFKPTWKETSRANIEQIKEKFKMFPETTKKPIGKWTLSELVALGEMQKESDKNDKR